MHRWQVWYLCQHWPGYWLVAWCHQAITWTNVVSSLMRSSDIHLWAISQEIQPSIAKIVWKWFIKFISKSSRANELISKEMTLSFLLKFWHMLIWLYTLRKCACYYGNQVCHCICQLPDLCLAYCWINLPYNIINHKTTVNVQFRILQHKTFLKANGECMLST